MQKTLVVVAVVGMSLLLTYARSDEVANWLEAREKATMQKEMVWSVSVTVKVTMDASGQPLNPPLVMQGKGELRITPAKENTLIVRGTYPVFSRQARDSWLMPFLVIYHPEWYGNAHYDSKDPQKLDHFSAARSPSPSLRHKSPFMNIFEQSEIPRLLFLYGQNPLLISASRWEMELPLPSNQLDAKRLFDGSWRPREFKPINWQIATQGDRVILTASINLDDKRVLVYDATKHIPLEGECYSGLETIPASLMKKAVRVGVSGLRFNITEQDLANMIARGEIQPKLAYRFKVLQSKQISGVWYPTKVIEEFYRDPNEKYEVTWRLEAVRDVPNLSNWRTVIPMGTPIWDYRHCDPMENSLDAECRPRIYPWQGYFEDERVSYLGLALLLGVPTLLIGWGASRQIRRWQRART